MVAHGCLPYPCQGGMQEFIRDERNCFGKLLMILLEMTQDPLGVDTGHSWRGHRILLKMTQDPFGDDTGSS